MNISSSFLSRSGIFAGSLLGAFALTAFASTTWTPPSSVAPGNNVDTPLNVGTTAQTKQGGSIQINGSFGIAGGTFVYLPTGVTQTAGMVLASDPTTPGKVVWTSTSTLGIGGPGGATVQTTSVYAPGTWCGNGYALGMGSGGPGGSVPYGPFVTCQGHNPAVDCPAGFTQVNFLIDARPDQNNHNGYTCEYTGLLTAGTVACTAQGGYNSSVTISGTPSGGVGLTPYKYSIWLPNVNSSAAVLQSGVTSPGTYGASQGWHNLNMTGANVHITTSDWGMTTTLGGNTTTTMHPTVVTVPCTVQ